MDKDEKAQEIGGAEVRVAVQDVTPPEKKVERRGRPKGVKDSRQAISNRKKSTILTLAAKNVPQAIIARETGLHPSCVSRVIKQYSTLLQELDLVPDFRNSKADLLDAAQLRLLKSVVDDRKLEAANLYQAAMAFDVMYKSGRLERNQSTANVSVAKFSRAVGNNDER